MTEPIMLPSPIAVRAVLLGQGIELRHLNHIHILSRDPTTIEVEGGGHVVLFRFGVAVLFNVSAIAEATFIELLRPFVRLPFDTPKFDDLDVRVESGAEERVRDGGLILSTADIPRLQVVADILAKSVLLEEYERQTAGTFDRIEPLAERLRSAGRLPRQAHELTRHIAEVLQIQHRMVGRAQVGEKPDVLWEYPEHERLWQRLENEYEIGERQLALERRLELIGTTAETLLGILEDRRTLRVEWYIVILIVIEIVLTLYELFFRHGP